MRADASSLFHSLRFKLIASVVTIEIIMLSLLVWNNIAVIHTTHTDRLRDTATSMIQQIAKTAGNYMIKVDYATLEDYLGQIMTYRELSYIAILDRDDNTVIAMGTATPDARPDPDTHPAKVTDSIYDIAQNIDVADRYMGRVLMGFSLSIMHDAIETSRNRGITIAIIEITLTIIVTIVIGLGLTRRLGALSNAVSDVEAGNYTVSVPIETDDEVGKTAAAFNSMVAEIARRTQQLLEEKKRTQKVLGENRQLIKKSLEVQEKERKNLARELHDELGQCITAIRADTESIKDLSKNNDKRITDRADAVLDVSAHIYDVVHSMMHHLRPIVLDNLGLEEALREEIELWNRRNPNTSCIYTFSSNLSGLGEHINITLYRIIQECLTNISKHAYAQHVSIDLKNDNRHLYLTIGDDGIGMDATSSDTHIGLGLIGMRERVQAVRGIFAYETSKDDGFRIKICIPLNEDEPT